MLAINYYKSVEPVTTIKKQTFAIKGRERYNVQN